MNDIKNKVRVRKFQKADAEEVQELIVRNFLEVNSKDYGIKAMQELAVNYGIDKILQIVSYAHMYVFELDDRIVGVGSISSFWGSETESILLTIFVLPELHGNGIGRIIMQTLGQDELYLRADRIEIPSSITATEFYRKFGYDYKDGIKELDSEQHYRLEKYKKIG
ncbi:GNAT family N-acetyltransferase [Eubacterium sp. BX4]|uniref:GNAT family N-acetyltransferase n=1 Tax=Eubacterium segne TaxID=2763045 RepID=A0ABR7F4K8_9FIRM|nr:GNAT family N-acetyltransferase [Eubacterium segne]MBC5668549.1 GNAT family N-acetyltransferase [Eubacterium segne]